jgi:RNA polymerase II elongation factor ELL
VSDGSKVSVFHVKLTDSALKAFESYRADQDSVSLRPSIRFDGSQGHICVPQPGGPKAVRTFSFYLSSAGRDGPQGSFDCVQQCVSSHGHVHLDCLGSIQDKVTVCATDDSYQKARQSMAQAEEETRSRSAIVIKAGGRYLEGPVPEASARSGGCSAFAEAGNAHQPGQRHPEERGQRGGAEAAAGPCGAPAGPEAVPQGRAAAAAAEGRAGAGRQGRAGQPAPAGGQCECP